MASRKASAIELGRLVDKAVHVKLAGGREVTGVLKVMGGPEEEGGGPGLVGR